MTLSGARTWDLFCRLVDNFGDVGVSWRLAADLACRGEQVRLWIDNASPLHFMAPGGARGVDVRPWPGDEDTLGTVVPGDVVIETFGCDLPERYIQRMLQRDCPPVWINLEYLGVEDFAQRSHALPSPQLNGLPKWFFYPGFAPGTGGLLREPDLQARRSAFDRNHWLGGMGLELKRSERVVVLFCYDNPALPALLNALALEPTLLLVAQGAAQQQVWQLLGSSTAECRLLRAHPLPWLTQAEFDLALWSADLNCIRGEDSLVRAIWAGAPVLWQLYPQEAATRELKLHAWLDHFFKSESGDAADTSVKATWLQLHRRYNDLDGLSASTAIALPDLAAWAGKVRELRAHLLLQTDLCTQLQAFAASKS